MAPTLAADNKTGYQRVSRRKKWALYLENSGLQALIDGISILLALLSVVLYVWSTYDLSPSAQDTFDTMNFALSIIFLAHYLADLWLADSRTAFIFHYQTVIDAVTIFPGFTEFLQAHSHIGATFLFLRALRIVRVLRVLRLLRATNLLASDVHRQLFHLAFTFAMMAFCSAGFFFELEQSAREAVSSPAPVQLSGSLSAAAAANHTGSDILPLLQLNGTSGGGSSTRFYFHDALYWSAVTIATVGYGDIAPITTEGRVMVLVLLLLMLYLIPYQTGKVLDALSATNPFLRASYRWHHPRRHIILTGSLDQLAVHSFVHELYHPDHGYQSHDTVLLRNELPDRHFTALLRASRNASRLTYAQGSPHTPKDLARVSAQSAKAIFVLANQGAEDPAREDMANIMLLLSTGNFLQRYHQRLSGGHRVRPTVKKAAHQLRHPRAARAVRQSRLARPFLAAGAEADHDAPIELPRLFIQLLLPESHHQLLQLLEALQSQSRASRSPSAGGFRSSHNMFWSAFRAEVTVICITELRRSLLGNSCLACPGVVGLVSNLSCTANICDLPSNHEVDEDWFQQYQDGSQMEVHQVMSFPAYLHGQPFATVALFLYHKYHSVLLGIAPAPGRSWGTDDVQLAPFEEVVSDGCIGFIIASSMQVSKSISRSSDPRVFQDWLGGSGGGTSKGGALQQEEDSSSGTGTPLPNPKGDAHLASSGAQIGTQALSSDLPHVALPQVRAPYGAPSGLVAPSEGPGSPAAQPASTAMQQGAVLVEGVQGGDTLQSLGSREPPLNDPDLVTRTQDLLLGSHRRAESLLASRLVLDRVDREGHILVLPCSPGCGDELVGIVCRLRALQLQRLSPIVVVAPELPADTHSEALASMVDVWFLLGDPKIREDLQRAGAGRAAKALLLGGPRQTASEDASLQEGALADAEVIFAFQHLKTLNHDLEIYCQVALSSSAAFLGPSLPFIPLSARNDEFTPRDTVVYAAGSVLLPEIFANITCQAFYSCHVYQLIQKLLSTGGTSASAPPASLGELAPTKDTGPTPLPVTTPSPERSLMVVPVDLRSLPPRTYTYGAWFEHCLRQRQLLCLGLYRSNGGDASPFVYTNPPADALLYSSDRAFVVVSRSQEAHLAQAFEDDVKPDSDRGPAC